DGRGCNQGSCAPALKQFQELRQPASLESALQIRRTGGAREAEGDVCPDDRTCGRRSGEFVPERTVASGENRGQDVRAREGRDGRTVQNRQKEEPRSSQVAERGEKSLLAARSWPLQQKRKHLGNIPIALCGASPGSAAGARKRSSNLVNDGGFELRAVRPPDKHLFTLKADGNVFSPEEFPRLVPSARLQIVFADILHAVHFYYDGSAPHRFPIFLQNLRFGLSPVFQVPSVQPSTANVNLFRPPPNHLAQGCAAGRRRKLRMRRIMAFHGRISYEKNLTRH